MRRVPTFQRLGFTLTPVARHPFGTANSLVQFGGSFLELLAIADPAAIPAGDGTHFSFGAFNRDFLDGGEGLSMLVLQERRCGRRPRRFRGARPAASTSLSASSAWPKGRTGQSARSRFSLTFTSDARLKRAGFFTCQHHYPENFWWPEYQRHANGATGIAAAVMVTRDPADFHEFLTHFTGVREMHRDQLRRFLRSRRRQPGRGAVAGGLQGVLRREPSSRTRGAFSGCG